MAGHSHAKTIKHRKSGQDAKRSKLFTKIQREIVIAVKASGSDEKTNPRLRLARQKARLCNMPNDKIYDAIKRASDVSNQGVEYEEAIYVVSLTGGLFLLIKALTDNKNRAASDIRGIASKAGATIAESSVASFIFSQIGVIKYELQNNNFDAIFEKSIEVGAADASEITMFEETEDGEVELKAIEVLCDFKDFGSVRTALEEAFGEPKIACIEWRPNNKMEPPESMEKITKLIDDLEDLDDVSSLYTNFLES